MKQIATQLLRTANAIRSKDWFNPKDILQARHMANNGRSVDEISAELEWGVSRSVAVSRLKKVGIRPFNSKRHNPHRGELGYLNKNDAPHGIVSQNCFRGRERQA